MEKKTLGLILKLPAQLILIAVAIGAMYAKIKNLYPMQWATPITIVVIVLLYFIGLYLSKKNSSSSFSGFSSSSKPDSPAIISLEPSKEVSVPALSAASLVADSGPKSRIVHLS